MRVLISMPCGVGEKGQVLHFKGIAPLKDSVRFCFFIEMPDGKRMNVGELASYGFGESLHDVYEVGVPNNRASAPKYDAFLEIPNDIIPIIQTHNIRELYCELEVVNATDAAFTYDELELIPA
ncbi:hypothetical protein KFE96_04565 [Kordiimonas sp. SCSIO 12603]|uniref:hypothetical protein n=1 Tax=Kordiimonas sp. SCSIO 12603 TaxID=2829596 RepID=UPI0021050E78|nr:hypothetical protein [Kordiimonas sp. SCSIO 12603]UTW59586.1 hypothetical protein KFE96_04565 [Kordiimonas sp. SCSIO 12603]